MLINKIIFILFSVLGLYTLWSWTFEKKDATKGAIGLIASEFLGLGLIGIIKLFVFIWNAI